MALLTYLEAIRQGLWEEMERDPSVFVMGEDIGAYGGAFKVTAGMLEKFGEDRVIDTPSSETAIVGAAIGAALMGMRPVVEMQFMDFIASGFDEIVNMAAKMHYRWGPAVPMVIRGPSGAGVHGGPYPLAVQRNVVCAHAGAEGGGARDCLRREGAHQSRHPRR